MENRETTTKKRENKQKTNNEIVDLNSNISIITLSVSGLKKPNKKKSLSK